MAVLPKCCPPISAIFLTFLALFSICQSALILPMEAVLDANSNAGFSLPDSILRELDQFEPSEKRAMSSSSSSSSSLEEDDQSETEKINHGHSSFPSLLSILSGLGQQFPQNQCFCCKAFVCRRQQCPCSKFFL